MKSTGYVLKERAYIGSATPPDAFEDESRFGNDGTHTDITWVQLPSGLWVRSFNGTSSIVRVTNSPSIKEIRTALTVLLWSNASAPDVAFETLIGVFDTGASQRAWRLGGYSAPPYGKLDVLATDDGAYASGHQYRLTTNSAVIDGIWHLFGLTWNAGAGILYVDAAVPAQTESPTDITTLWPSTADLIIGAWLNSDTAESWITGDIALPRIYNYVLSAGKIKQIFEAERHWFGI